MRPRRLVAVAVLAVSASCGREPVAAGRSLPATIATISQLPDTIPVGANVGEWRVRVTDSAGTPVVGIPVFFAVGAGNGSVSRQADVTDESGRASTTLRVGTAAGTNAFSATTHGLRPIETKPIAGTPGSARSVTAGTRTVRFAPGSDSTTVSFIARDAFGNVMPVTVALASRNDALVTVANAAAQTAAIRVAARPGQTWVVGAYDGFLDSVSVIVLDGSSTPCAYVAAPVALAVGESVAADGSIAACMKTPANAEFVLVSHYNTTVPNAMASTSITGAGVVLPGPFPSLAYRVPTPADPAPDVAFERALREREREIESRAAAARVWRRSQAASLVAQTNPQVGTFHDVNVNASAFCESPTWIRARVAAVTDAAIVLHDMSNPAGGFTDAEYHAFGRMVDTLIYPVDTAAFGAPTDLDRNGRIVVLFTQAVNALTARDASTITLGFFYSRDLLPRRGTPACPGSNDGEVFYVLVPDPTGVVSAPRSMDFVQTRVPAIIAHELQHLINSSRRLYVNDAHATNEETWLSEGLSHMAEELTFYRASGRVPRQNIGAAELADPATRAAFDLFQALNFRRYLEYLRLPDGASPIATNGLVSTRGAAWAFLRYLADRAGPADGDIWRRLVNSRTQGVRNVDAVLDGTGLTVAGALRDWSVAVAVDDLVGSAGGAPFQPSWHFLSAFPLAGITEWLAPPSIVAGGNLQTLVRGGSSAYARFATAAGQEALIQAGNPSGTPTRGMRFTIVRIK